MVAAVEIIGGFDYGILDSEQQGRMRSRIAELSGLMRQNLRNAIRSGQILLETKEDLGYGLYRRWIDTDFPWGKTTANEFEHVAECFKDVRNLDNFDLEAAKILARPSTSDEARTKAIALAEDGEYISNARAKALKAGTDTQVIQAGKPVTVVDETSPLYGQTVMVNTIDKKDGVVRCETEAGDEVPLPLAELLPQPTPQPVQVPKAKPQPQPSNQIVQQIQAIEHGRSDLLEAKLREAIALLELHAGDVPTVAAWLSEARELV